MRIYSNVYDCAIYTLNYEDKYLISLFAHFKHTVKIHYHHTYIQITIKRLNDKCSEMHFLGKQFKCALMFWNEFFEGAFLKNIYVWKCIFWESNFNVPLCFEMHFLREHFWRVCMFWNAFFERAILMCTYVLKCIFWGSNLNVHLCFEMHFLREQFI